jgi:hypothetical protein
MMLAKAHLAELFPQCVYETIRAVTATVAVMKCAAARSLLGHELAFSALSA